MPRRTFRPRAPTGEASGNDCVRPLEGWRRRCNPFRPLMRLAAQSGLQCVPPEIGTEAGVHALFVDSSTGQGCIRGVVARLVSAERFEIIPHRSVRCDAVMHAAAQRGLDAAISELTSIGFAIPERGQAIEWRIGNEDDPPTIYSGASIGLAIAAAAAALLTGARIPFDVAVSGAVDGPRVEKVRGIAEKVQAAASHDVFSQVVVPAENMADLPPAARSARRPRVIPVVTVRQAISVLLGLELGVGVGRLAADSDAKPTEAASIVLDLWIDPPEQKPATRSICSLPVKPPEVWNVGNEIGFGVWASADCHVLLLNRGSSGRIQTLVPSVASPDARLDARQALHLPRFELQGPPGVEHLIALATRRPAYDVFSDLLGAIDRGTAIMPDVLKAVSGPQVLGHASLELHVEAAAAPSASTRSLGPDLGQLAYSAKTRWLAIDLG